MIARVSASSSVRSSVKQKVYLQALTFRWFGKQFQRRLCGAEGFEFTSFSVFNVLLAQLLWQYEGEPELDWSKVLLKASVPISGKRVLGSLEQGIAVGLVRYVLRQVPQTTPGFLLG